jgi:hypothetical protein
VCSLEFGDPVGGGGGGGLRILYEKKWSSFNYVTQQCKNRTIVFKGWRLKRQSRDSHLKNVGIKSEKSESKQ